MSAWEYDKQISLFWLCPTLNWIYFKLSQPSEKFFIILKRGAGNTKIGLMMIIMHIMNLNTCAITGRAHSLSLEQNSANKKAKSIHSFWCDVWYWLNALNNVWPIKAFFIANVGRLIAVLCEAKVAYALGQFHKIF